MPASESVRAREFAAKLRLECGCIRTRVQRWTYPDTAPTAETHSKRILVHKAQLFDNNFGHKSLILCRELCEVENFAAAHTLVECVESQKAPPPPRGCTFAWAHA